MSVAKRGRWDYVLICLAIALPVYSFFPVTPKPEDNALDTVNVSRLTEFALLALSAYLLTSIAINRRYHFRMRGYALSVCVAYVAWALCSTLWSRDPVYTFAKSIEFLLLTYIATLVMVCYRGPGGRSRGGFEMLVTYAGLISIVLSLISNTIIWGTPFHFHQNEGRTRLGFGYSHPLETADLCAATAIIAFASPLRLPVRVALVAMLAAIVAETDARSTLVFLFLILGIVAVLQIKSPTRRVLAGVFCVFAVYAAAILFIDGDVNFLPQDFSTLNGRTVLWEESLNIAYQHLWLGVGYFATGRVLVSLFDWAGNAHNAYLEVLIATGIVGLFLLLVFLAYCAWLCARSRSIPLLATLLFVCLESTFNPLLFSPRTPMLFLILLMLSASELPVPVARVVARRPRLAPSAQWRAIGAAAMAERRPAGAGGD